MRRVARTAGLNSDARQLWLRVVKDVGILPGLGLADVMSNILAVRFMDFANPTSGHRLNENMAIINTHLQFAAAQRCAFVRTAVVDHTPRVATFDPWRAAPRYAGSG